MRAGFTTASVARHSIGALAEALLVAAIVGALTVAMAAVSGAAPGGAAPVAAARGVITVPDGVYAGTTTATVNPGGSGAWARARCYQSGTLVYEQYLKVDANNQATFTLGPTQLWTSGAATCTGEELSLGRNQRWHTLATTTFNVSG